MRLCYVLLSPTWGMHQYTADLANRMAAAGHEVHLVSTRLLPRDRYSPQVTLHTPVTIKNTGFSPAGLAAWALRPILRSLRAIEPDVVHVTGPHLWNPLLLAALRRSGVPTIHTIHDLHPHAGAVYGRLLYLWNGWVQRSADHLLVHGQCFRKELLARGIAPTRVTSTPLTHLFLSYEREHVLDRTPPAVTYEPWALFLGRLEVYKGLNVLVQAADLAAAAGENKVQVLIAGPGQPEELLPAPIPPTVQVRAGLIHDDEAVDLIGRCGLVVLPYIEASQSALVAAAYAFCKPVVVTAVGALPEYVIQGETGWVLPPNDPDSLATILQNALDDPERLAQMGTAGRAWYDSHRAAEQATLSAMYNRVYAGRRQP